MKHMVKVTTLSGASYDKIKVNKSVTPHDIREFNKKLRPLYYEEVGIIRFEEIEKRFGGKR